MEEGKMIRIGITGHEGFVGRHVVRALGRRDDVEVHGLDRGQHDLAVPGKALDEFVAGLDVVIHLAGVNRAEDDAAFERGNVEATRTLLDAVSRGGGRPLVVLSSTIHAARDTVYGRTKRAAEDLVAHYGAQHGLPYAILRITNVFGAGCRPFYNSVVATFCHQVAHGEEPQVQQDAELALIPVNHVVQRLVALATAPDRASLAVRETLSSDFRITVAGLRDRLREYAALRRDAVVPQFADVYDRELYATYLSYLPPDGWVTDLERKRDHRGDLVEAFRFATQGQVFFSTSKPGVTRGNHYHTRKVERFLVVEGEAELRLRHLDSNEVVTYRVSGAQPQVVEIPVHNAHNITNVGDSTMVLIVWVNERFDPNDPDTFYADV